LRSNQNKMKKIFFLLLITITSVSSFSQEDTLFSKTLTELVVTATRTERKLSNVAVPVQIISRKAITQSGSVRLNDILSEQTGLYITSGGATTSAGGGVFGNGIQIQGLSPDYTLILLDGEPIIGRQGGVIDLSRLSVGNIKKIEIVKGPSSSLYGSEAMGGVVNIITEQAQVNRLDASFRYGRFNSTDANLSAAIKKQKWGLQLFGNRNSSNGFDLDETAPGKTVDPFKSYTTQARFNFSPSAKTKIGVSGRYYNEKQDNYFLTQDIKSVQGKMNSIHLVFTSFCIQRVLKIHSLPVHQVCASIELKKTVKFLSGKMLHHRFRIFAPNPVKHPFFLLIKDL